MTILKATSVFTIGYIITGTSIDAVRNPTLSDIIVTVLVVVVIGVWWQATK